MTDKDFKETQKDEEELAKDSEKRGSNFYMFNTVSRENLDNFIDNLYNPNFLGSIHMKKGTKQPSATPKTEITDEVLKNELNLKMDDNMKNTIFNPITKLLLVAMIIFNIGLLIFSLL
ncbi:MAG: hypothetical protein R6U96_00200 [Promethearchaeia archaeon]